MTTDDDQTSVEKCRASASSAWLRYFLAARSRARERERSTAMETAITAKAQALHETARARCEEILETTARVVQAARFREHLRVIEFAEVPHPPEHERHSASADPKARQMYYAAHVDDIAGEIGRGGDRGCVLDIAGDASLERRARVLKRALHAYGPRDPQADASLESRSGSEIGSGLEERGILVEMDDAQLPRPALELR